MGVVVMTTTKEGKLNEVEAIGGEKTAATQRDALLGTDESSGLSGPGLVALHGVNYQIFAIWLRKRKRRTGTGAGWSASLSGPLAPFAGTASFLVEPLAARRVIPARLVQSVQPDVCIRQEKGVAGHASSCSVPGFSDHAAVAVSDRSS